MFKVVATVVESVSNLSNQYTEVKNCLLSGSVRMFVGFTRNPSISKQSQPNPFTSDYSVVLMKPTEDSKGYVYKAQGGVSANSHLAKVEHVYLDGKLPELKYSKEGTSFKWDDEGKQGVFKTVHIAEITDFTKKYSFKNPSGKPVYLLVKGEPGILIPNTAYYYGNNGYTIKWGDSQDFVEYSLLNNPMYANQKANLKAAGGKMYAHFVELL